MRDCLEPLKNVTWKLDLCILVSQFILSAHHMIPNTQVSLAEFFYETGNVEFFFQLRGWLLNIAQFVLYIAQIVKMGKTHINLENEYATSTYEVDFLSPFFFFF